MNRRGQDGRGSRGRVGGFVPFNPKQLSGLAAWYTASSVAGAVSDPTTISGLVSWFRADKGITIGTGVSSWTDSAPGADGTHTLTQATGTKQPTFNASDAAYNNQPTLSFASAASQSLVSGTWTTPLGVRTMMVIGNFDGAASLEYFTDGLTVDTSAIWNNATASNITVSSNGIGSTLTYSGTIGSTPHMVSCTFDNGASCALYVDSNTASTTGTSGSSSLTGLNVGCAGNTSAFLNGKIAEVAIFNRALTQPEIQALAAYAAQRYGLTISIGTLNDQSGSGDSNKNMAQATQTAQPTLNTADGSYKSKPTLSFASAKSQTIVSGTWSLPLNQPYTTIVVGNDDGTATPQLYLTTGITIYEFGNNGGGKYYISGNASLTSNTAVSAAPRVAISVCNTTNSAIYLSAKTADVTGTIGTNVQLSSIRLGAQGTPTFFLNGKIAEAIIYSRVLSQADINRVLAYLGQKYGISIGA